MTNELMLLAMCFFFWAMFSVYGGLLGLVLGLISVLSLRFSKRIGRLHTTLLLAQVLEKKIGEKT